MKTWKKAVVGAVLMIGTIGVPAAVTAMTTGGCDRAELALRALVGLVHAS